MSPPEQMPGVNSLIVVKPQALVRLVVVPW